MFNLEKWMVDAIEDPKWDEQPPLSWGDFVPDDVQEMWWDLEWDAQCAVIKSASFASEKYQEFDVMDVVGT